MLTLNQLKNKSKKYGILSIKILGALFALFLLLKLGLAIKEIILPSPPPAPETAFGKLQKLTFPQGEDSAKFSYSVDTLSGNLPNFPTIFPVYKMIGYVPNLLDLENTQRAINLAGFLGTGAKISDRLYGWQSQNGSRLTVDILTKDYNLDIRLLQENSATQISSEDQAMIAANAFVDSFFPPDDLDRSKTQATLLSLQGSTMTKVQSLSATNLVAVNYFQKDINNYQIFYPKNDFSTMTIYVGKGNPSPKVIGANFQHQYVGNDSSTYPLITSQEAIGMLKKGEGYIVSSDPNNKNVGIKNVILGYYMSEDKQSYLQPIMIFEGNNFVAYVSAIKGEWLSK